MRRIPSQVPQAVSRLLQASVLSTPPTWYIPVLTNPPPQLPARQTLNRPRASRPALQQQQQQASEAFTDVAYIPPGELEKRDRLRKYRSRKSAPARISYAEDRIRRQFFKDFPFEALRPTSLVEGQEIDQSVKISGEQWTRLEQRGLYPSVEDTIEFVLNVQRTQSLPLSQAYAIATAEFIELRGRHELATLAAEVEARHYGAQFKADAFERQFNLEEKSLSTLQPPSSASSSSTSRIKHKYKPVPRWRWSNTVSGDSIPSGEFTAGREYASRWKWEMPAPLEASLPSSASSFGVVEDAGAAAAVGKAGEQESESESESDLEFLQNVLSRSKA
ncbi:hypothetical protein I317_04148 [Kwoniella heveanensis CBS 569]|uniref:Small ribosomal subunit protein mS23 n=1 Tax=Kwoniella heveanensis BCC8398 TaxID=1296120 RepID=A0A1B9GQX4_9TREE|nr:hypothetical protein I316_04885 [Kwoniella heveanensis BCC8398]OCF42061.1 hypothetical protein I317_04148 [Kwoniella heveanensis CBS 569]